MIKLDALDSNWYYIAKLNKCEFYFQVITRLEYFRSYRMISTGPTQLFRNQIRLICSLLKKIIKIIRKCKPCLCIFVSLDCAIGPNSDRPRWSLIPDATPLIDKIYPFSKIGLILNQCTVHKLVAVPIF